MLTASGTGGNGAFMEIERVGVIGAGQMGNGIAHVFALAGYEVLLNDVTEAEMARRPDRPANIDRQVGRGKVTGRGDARLRADPHRPASPSLVARPDIRPRRERERSSSKSQRAGAAPDAHTILTSNTSSISITRLAAAPTGPRSSWASTS